MRQAFFSVACPVLLSLIKCYFVVACRFKRQISVKPQCAGSEAPTKPQYTRICSVFGVKIKYRAVSIYSFSKNTHTTPFCQITALSGVSISQLLFYLLHTLWHNGFLSDVLTEKSFRNHSRKLIKNYCKHDCYGKTAYDKHIFMTFVITKVFKDVHRKSLQNVNTENMFSEPGKNRIKERYLHRYQYHAYGKGYRPDGVSLYTAAPASEIRREINAQNKRNRYSDR